VGLLFPSNCPKWRVVKVIILTAAISGNVSDVRTITDRELTAGTNEWSARLGGTVKLPTAQIFRTDNHLCMYVCMYACTHISASYSVRPRFEFQPRDRLSWPGSLVAFLSPSRKIKLKQTRTASSSIFYNSSAIANVISHSTYVANTTLLNKPMKSKAVPVPVSLMPWRYIEEGRYSSTQSSPRHYMEVNGQLQSLAALLPGKEPLVSID